MKRYIIIIMYMCLALLTGCGSSPSGWQTGDVTLVQALGVDLAADGVGLAAFAGDGSAVQAPSVAEGMRKLRASGDRFLHFGHTEQLLLSERFARDGVEQLLDYIARDRQLGPGVRLWVLRGEGMDGLADVSARLTLLAAENDGAGPKLECTATRLMGALAGGDSVAVPAVERQNDALTPCGYAVLRQGRLVGFLEDEQALGLELLCGRGGGQIVDVSLPDGGRLALAVGDGAVSCVPLVANGGVQGLQLRWSASAEVVQGAAVPTGQRAAVTGQAEVALCSRMTAALACAQLWDADFMGLEQLARAACAQEEWNGMNWEIGLRTLPLQAAAELRVRWPADLAEAWGE